MNAPRGLARQLVANTLHAASGRVAAMVVWLVLTPWILRALGAEGFAVWSLFLAFSGYLAALDLGFAQMTLRHVAAARGRGDHSEAGDYATLAIAGYAALGVLWLALGALAPGPLLDLLRLPAASRPDAAFAIIAGGAVFLIAGAANVMIAVAQGYGRFDLANLVTLTLTIQQAIGTPIVLANGWGLRGLVVNLALGWALSVVVGRVVVARHVPEFHLTSITRALGRWRQALRFGGAVQINNILGVTHQQADKFLLVRFVSLAAVTPYELGFRVVAAASSFPQVLLLALMPAASALHAVDDAPRLRELYERANRYVMTVTAVVVAAMLGAADRLYFVWIGPGHGEAALALRGLALAAAFVLGGGVATSVARGIGRPDMEAWFSFVALVVHLGLCLWLLPRIGLAGALISMIAGNLVGAVHFVWRVSGKIGLSRTRAVLTPFGVPSLALALGAAAGVLAERALPAGAGVWGWVLLVVTAAVSSLVALAVCLATRYVALSEARALLGRAAPESAAQ